MLYVRATPAVAGAQWTGAVTTIAREMLQSGLVDAVALVGADPEDPLSPSPFLARTVEEVTGGRGVKPSLAPSLAILDEVREDKAIRRLLFCGVGCSVQALRAVEDDLDLDDLFVLGTNCVDNSPNSGATRGFLKAAGVDAEQDDQFSYEFMADFRVHVKKSAPGREPSYQKVPYFSLPGTYAKRIVESYDQEGWISSLEHEILASVATPGASCSDGLDSGALHTQETTGRKRSQRAL